MREFFDSHDGRVVVENDTIVWKQRMMGEIRLHFQDIEDYKFVWSEALRYGRVEINLKLRPNDLFCVRRSLFADETNVE